MRARLTDERGFAVATALMVITIMIALGLATATLVDNQSRQTGRERLKETTFNVGEAVLNAQALQLSATWPGSATSITAPPFPTSCIRGSTNTECPDSTTVASGFQGTDFSAATNWTVTVRDNIGTAASYYDKTALDSSSCPGPTGTISPCTWDSNGDGQLWVRSQATVAGEARTMVALVKLNQIQETFPQNTITAGKFSTTNSGKKVIVDTKGCAAVGAPVGGCLSQRAAPVVVRCTTPRPATGYVRGNGCLGFDESKGQISPPGSTQTGFAGRALPLNAVDDFRRRAKALNTYYGTTCPASLTGAVVFVENANCSYSTGTFNSAAAPGVVVFANGTLSIVGTVTYFGVIYMANTNASTADLVTLGGAATIQGSVVVEGNGGILAGSNKLNIVFDPRAVANVYGYGSTAEPAQNTFRELSTGQ